MGGEKMQRHDSRHTTNEETMTVMIMKSGDETASALHLRCADCTEIPYF